MRLCLKHFLSDESGAMTLDWVVLTGALVGTGLAVMGQVGTGIESTSAKTATSLRGEVVRSSFGSDYCSGGISALQAREDQRVTAGGEGAIDVALWIDTYTGGMDDTAIVQEHDRLRELLTSSDGWSRDQTIMTALECEMVLRGLD